MIQINTPPSPERQSVNSRAFTKVLRTLKPYLKVFDVNLATHTVKAIFPTAKSGCHQMDIAIDTTKNRLACIVQLRAGDIENTSQSKMLLQMQNTLAGFGMVTFDKETHTLRIRSLISSTDPSVIAAMLADIQDVIENETLNLLTNQPLFNKEIL